MSKKFLFLIALSLYVGNSNCAAAKEEAEDSIDSSKIIKDLQDAQDILVVHKTLNKFFFDLKRSGLNKKARFASLSNIRNIIAKKAKGLVESDFKNSLNFVKNSLFDCERMKCLHKKPHIMCDSIECPLVYGATPYVDATNSASLKERREDDMMSTYAKLLADNVSS